VKREKLEVEPSDIEQEATFAPGFAASEFTGFDVNIRVNIPSCPISEAAFGCARAFLS
jgi:hypothetical protein